MHLIVLGMHFSASGMQFPAMGKPRAADGIEGLEGHAPFRDGHVERGEGIAFCRAGMARSGAESRGSGECGAAGMIL